VTYSRSPTHHQDHKRLEILFSTATPTVSESQPLFLSLQILKGWDTPPTQVSLALLARLADPRSFHAPPPGKFPQADWGSAIATVTGTAYAYLKWRPVESKILDEIRVTRQAKYESCMLKQNSY